MRNSSQPEREPTTARDHAAVDPLPPLAQTVLARVEAQILCLEWLATNLREDTQAPALTPGADDDLEVTSPWAGACAALAALTAAAGSGPPRDAIERAAAECGALLGRIARGSADAALRAGGDEPQTLRTVYDRYVEAGEALYAEAIRSGEVGAALRPLVDVLARR
ncbi:MAG: hypothetical protein H6983_05060 [Ectothiorhodospiraceae bacterium]|nr:hypothetical protein [Chromatiales bacterium]MCP5153511.1 hypothetical protein [Ectothiorhodospiraceae bacterium]